MNKLATTVNVLLTMGGLFLSSAVATPILDMPMIHSHNDYKQEIPFWYAYGSNAKSIEIDLVIENNRLYISHGDDIIDTKRTIESLYLEPLQNAVNLDIGSPQNIHFLVDMKSDAQGSIDLLLPILKRYEPTIEKSGVTFVISGNRTPLESYVNLPDYIQMDYQSLEPVTDKAAWDKVSMISLAFKSYSTWNGEGDIPLEDQIKIKEVVETAHAMNKPFRFWGTPDTENAWNQLWELGVDVINTDQPDIVNRYLSK